MKIPTMASLDDRKLEIQPFGGLNTSKLDTEIDDNQMSDVNNFYYKNKLLSMRPGLIKQIEQTYGKIVDVYPNDGATMLLKRAFIDNVLQVEKYGIYILTLTNILTYDGTTIVRVPTMAEWSTDHWEYHYSTMSNAGAKILPYGIQKEDLVEISTYKILSDGIVIVGNDNAGGNSLYFVIPQVIYWPFPIGQIHITQDVFLFTKTPHAPVILTNMAPSGKGDALESRNYLTPQCQCEFITNNVDKIYNLPDKTIDNTDVTITYNDLTGATNSLFVYDANATVCTIGTITATLDRTLGIITFSVALTDGAAKQAAVPNMTVQYAKTIYADPNPILKCKIAAWFGGSYQGLASGDSVFLSGNPDEPNAVYWSAAKDPTYFPINNTDYVGSPSDPVTAFGKAFSKLVILKQNSVYEKGFSWDSVNSKAYFPTSEIHVGIGCDMPKSVQLIANNLTWANSKGGVYTLTTTSTTSTTSNISTERVIQPLSQNINKDLLANSKYYLQNAVSVDDGFYYYLFVNVYQESGVNGSHIEDIYKYTIVYLWDYNTTPFINYSDTVKLQNRLAWYKWKIPFPVSNAFLYNNKLYISSIETGGVVGQPPYSNGLYVFDDMQSLDEGGAWFDAYLTSKAFDNGIPERLKQVNKMWLSLSSVDYMTIEGLLVDEYGEQTELIDIDENSTVSPFKLSLSSEWTQQYKVGVRRIEGDNGAFGLNKFIINAKIGRLI
jgi:hypothetical protein